MGQLFALRSDMPAQHMKAPEQAREDTSPAKIDVTSKSPVGDISVVTLIRTDTTLDHSQKAEKVTGDTFVLPFQLLYSIVVSACRMCSSGRTR